MTQYIQTLSDEKYLELARIVDPTTKSVRVTQKDDGGVGIYLAATFDDGGTEREIEDFYMFYDYNIEPYDAPNVSWDTLVAYRTKMLEWFGDEYARNHLLSD